MSEPNGGAIRDETDTERPVVSGRDAGTARRVGIYLSVALAIFLIGFVPMWLKARTNAAQRDAAQRELRLSQRQNALTAAAIDARRGEYEMARQSASEFFTSLRDQLDAPDAEIMSSQREAVKPLLAQRDEIITLLARSDPAAADRLSDLYVAYQKAMQLNQSEK